MIVLGDKQYVFGVVESKPLLKIPSEALGWKLRLRPKSFAYIYIRFNYGVEKRAILDRGDNYEVDSQAVAVNITGKTQ
jgi:hypothetical protein